MGIMNIEEILFGENTVKSLVFTILIKEYPLRLIELTNFIRKRYGRSVTFPAVRKAVMQMIEQGILQQTGHEFQINIEWLVHAREHLESVYHDLTNTPSAKQHFRKAQGIQVYHFDSPNKLLLFWEDIIDQWFVNYKGQLRINCYQGAHLWEGLLHPDREQSVMGQLKKKKIKSYAVCTGSTPLDRAIAMFYTKIGLRTHIIPSLAKFDRTYYVGTYGDLILQTQYPKELCDELDNFFKKNNNIDSLNLQELSKLVNKKIPMKLTVIADEGMAKQINKSILSNF